MSVTAVVIKLADGDAHEFTIEMSFMDFVQHLFTENNIVCLDKTVINTNYITSVEDITDEYDGVTKLSAASGRGNKVCS